MLPSPQSESIGCATDEEEDEEEEEDEDEEEEDEETRTNPGGSAGFLCFQRPQRQGHHPSVIRTRPRWYCGGTSARRGGSHMPGTRGPP